MTVYRFDETDCFTRYKQPNGGELATADEFIMIAAGAVLEFALQPGIEMRFKENGVFNVKKLTFEPNAPAKKPEAEELAKIKAAIDEFFKAVYGGKR